MRRSLYSALALAVALASAGAAQAERSPTLDDVLAETLQSPTPTPRANQDAKRCRTLTDMARRSRRATVCMAQADWDVLIRAAQRPASHRSAALKVSVARISNADAR